MTSHRIISWKMDLRRTSGYVDHKVDVNARKNKMIRMLLLLWLLFLWSFRSLFAFTLVGFWNHKYIFFFWAFIVCLAQAEAHLYIIHFNQFYFLRFLFSFFIHIHYVSAYLFFSLHSCICSSIWHTAYSQAHVQYNISVPTGFLDQRVFWHWVYLVLPHICDIFIKLIRTFFECWKSYTLPSLTR